MATAAAAIPSLCQVRNIENVLLKHDIWKRQQAVAAAWIREACGLWGESKTNCEITFQRQQRCVAHTAGLSAGNHSRLGNILDSQQMFALSFVSRFSKIFTYIDLHNTRGRTIRMLCELGWFVIVIYPYFPRAAFFNNSLRFFRVFSVFYIFAPQGNLFYCCCCCLCLHKSINYSMIAKTINVLVAIFPHPHHSHLGESQ